MSLKVASSNFSLFDQVDWTSRQNMLIIFADTYSSALFIYLLLLRFTYLTIYTPLLRELFS